MNTSSKTDQTPTVDYSNYLQVKNPNQNLVTAYLETTIFQILRNHSDVFIFNEFEILNIKEGFSTIVLENGILIGQGGHGNVYQTHNPQTNKEAALKVQNDCTLNAVLQYAQEFKIQKIIESIFPDCIIKIQGKVFITQNYFESYKMQTYLELGIGSLKDYKEKKNEFTETEIDYIYGCILDGIIKIHFLNIAHRDIKLNNIIMTKDNGWVLADFGCSTQYKTPYGEYPIVGTIQYNQKSIRQAYNQNRRTCKINLFKNDIYAFQIVMLQLIYPKKTILELNTILDERQMIHPKINQLYDKDFHSIKSDFSKIKFIRQPSPEEDDFNIINFDQTIQDFKNNPIIQFIFNVLASCRQLRVYQNLLRKNLYQEYQKNKGDQSVIYSF